jgi:hypothetical protein
MRWLPLVALVGCSSPPPAVVELEPTDSGAVVEPDAEPSDAGAPRGEACIEAQATVVLETPCDGGGFLYGSYGGTCPAGDVGKCRVIFADGIGNYAEACCEHLACVRTRAALDQQCDKAFDGGLPDGWNCPDDQGPPDGCKPKFPGARDYCCPAP